MLDFFLIPKRKCRLYIVTLAGMIYNEVDLQLFSNFFTMIIFSNLYHTDIHIKSSVNEFIIDGIFHKMGLFKLSEIK